MAVGDKVDFPLWEFVPVRIEKVGQIGSDGRPILGTGEVIFEIDRSTSTIIIDKRDQEQKREMKEKFGIPE